jgi:hypothetical protein
MIHFCPKNDQNVCRVCANLSCAYQTGFDHFTKWKSGVFFKEHVKYMRPQYPDLSDEELFMKIKNDFVAARQIRDQKKKDGELPNIALINDKGRKKISKEDDSRGEDIGRSVDAALEDDIEDETEDDHPPTDPAAPISNHDSEEDLHLAKKRLSHRGDSTNREAKRAKFMVKIARLDEEAAILKEQATVVKNKWLAWEMQRLSTK